MSTPQLDLVRLEASKTVATRGRVLVLIAFAALALTFMLVQAAVEEQPTVLQIATQGFAVLGFALPVAAIVAFAQDWQGGGMHFTVTRFARREQIWAVKLAVLLAAVVGAVALTVLTATALAGGRGLGSDAGALVWAAVPTLANSLLAVGLSCLILRTGLSVLAFVVVSSLLGPVVGLLFRDADRLTRWFQYDGLMTSVSSGLGSAADLVSVALWVTVPLAAGYLSFRHRGLE